MTGGVLKGHKNSFGDIKGELVSLIKGLEESAEKLGMESDSRSFHNLKERVDEGKLKVIVIGEFNRGKSTFINALLGDNVLPTAVRPTTATINIVNYGEKPAASVHFKDDHEQLIDIDKLDEYVTVQGKNLADVKYVEIAYPTEFCKDGVQIIDTPGVNDLDKQREEVTYGFIPGADAAVLVLDSEAAVSQSEMVFLKEKVLKNDIQKIFIVLNKCENLDTDEMSEVLEYARDKLKDVASSDRIFPLSAREALKLATEEGPDGRDSDESFIEKMNSTGVPEFRDALSAFLLHERGGTLLTVPLERAMRLSGRMMTVAALRRESLAMDAEGQNARLKKMEPALLEHDHARERLKKRMEKASRELSRHFEAKIREDMLNIGKSMEQTIAETHIDPDFVKDLLPDILRKKVCASLEENQKEIQERITELERRAIDDVQQCISQLDTVVFREISFHQQKKLINDLRLEKTAHDKEGMMFELGPVVTLGGFGYLGFMVLGVIGLIPAFFGAAYIKDLLGDKQQERLIRDLNKSIASLVKDMEVKVISGINDSISKTITIISEELVRQIDESQNGVKTTFDKMVADLKKSDKERERASFEYTEIGEQIKDANHQLSQLKKKLIA
jgi:small GTP-binding protein